MKMICNILVLSWCRHVRGPWDKYKIQDSMLHFVFLQHKRRTIVLTSVYLMSARMLCHPPTYSKDLKGHDTSKILAVEFVLDLVNFIFDCIKMWILTILQPSTCILMKEALMWTMIPCPIAIILNKIHKVSWNTLIFHETKMDTLRYIILNIYLMKSIYSDLTVHSS